MTSPTCTMSSSFYEGSPDNALRFGDVVDGFPVSASQVESPILGDVPKQYKIDVKPPEYSVILTPCCSIGSGTLLLAPFQKVNRRLYDNPYLSEDLLRLNFPMTPQQAVLPTAWERMSSEERARRIDTSRPKSYAFVEYFMYAPHDRLPEYNVTTDGRLRTGHYSIDFRCMYRIECKKINTATQSPVGAKVVQITVSAREALRDKLVAYFARVPEEDEL